MKSKHICHYETRQSMRETTEQKNRTFMKSTSKNIREKRFYTMLNTIIDYFAMTTAEFIKTGFINHPLSVVFP